MLAALLVTPLLAQQQIPAQLLQPELRRDIPLDQGGGEAVRLVDLDADGDLIRDFAILWSNGTLTFAYAPEILNAFAPCPVTGVTGVTVIPRAFTPGASGRDGLLVADAGGLAYVALADGAPGSQSASTLTRQPVPAPATWQQIERVESFVFASNCMLLGLAPDQLTVRLGKWESGVILDLGAVSANSAVMQMVMVDFQQTGLPCIAVRTVVGLQLWTTTGIALAAYPAPTEHPFGALTTFRAGSTQRLAWVALSDHEWQMNIVQDAQLQPAGIVTCANTPNRFRLNGIGAVPNDPVSGTDELIIYQNTRPWHIRGMPPETTGTFTATDTIASPGTTSNVDNCPSLCVDLDHDGITDVATVLTSLHCLQFQPTQPPTGAQPALTGDDILGTHCAMTASNGNAGLDTLNLEVDASAETSRPNLAVQVVAWPVTVPVPEGPNFGAVSLGAAKANFLFPLVDTAPGATTLNMAHPVLPFTLPVPPGGWGPTEQYLLMVRFVQCSAPIATGERTMIWTSEPRVVGCVLVGEDPQGNMPSAWHFVGYMNSISTPNPPPTTTVSAEPRNVGLLLRGSRLKPPASTVPVPAPNTAVVRTPPTTQWQ